MPKHRIVFGQLSDKIQNITDRHITRGEKAKFTSLSFEDTEWFRELEERPKSAFAVIVAVLLRVSERVSE